jgi:hypothetical protein
MRKRKNLQTKLREKKIPIKLKYFISSNNIIKEVITALHTT